MMFWNAFESAQRMIPRSSLPAFSDRLWEHSTQYLLTGYLTCTDLR